MKQYWLFAGMRYYPSGGWNDFYYWYDSMEEARDDAHSRREKEMWNWYHIVNAWYLQTNPSEPPVCSNG